MSNTPIALNWRYYSFTSIRVIGRSANWQRAAPLPRFIAGTIFDKPLRGLNWCEQTSKEYGYSCSTSVVIAEKGFDSFTRMQDANGINGYSDLTIEYRTQERIVKVEWKESSIFGPSTTYRRLHDGRWEEQVTLTVGTGHILTNGIYNNPSGRHPGSGVTIGV